MKKFFSLLCALTIILSASAAPAKVFTKIVNNQKIEVKKAPRLQKAQHPAIAKAPQAKADETPLASGTFYTVGGTFKASGVDHTADMPYIEVAVSGANIAIVGLAYYFPEGTVTGTISGNTITIPSGQLLGSDEYGPEYLVGTNDGSTVCDIVFTYDPEEQTLEAETYYIIESASATEVQAYAYWILPVFSAVEPEEPELVELPEGATVVEYTMEFLRGDNAKDARAIYVAVVDDQVYFQGMSAYFPDSWVVGTKVGNAISFAANQYMGKYDGDASYFFYDEDKADVVFTYDAAKDTYSAQGQIFGLLGDYYDGNYTNPVLGKAKAVDYNNPIIAEITDAVYKFEENYNDVIYTFSNATADTAFQFNIYLDAGLKDVVLGQKYLMEDMEPSSYYTFVEINGVATALKMVSFTKTQEESEDVPSYHALVIDMRNNFYEFACTLEAEKIAPIEIPEGVETASYKFDGYDTYEEETVVKFVQVGFDGDDVYIQGMSGYLEEAWIKGTKNAEGVYEFPSCILGTYESFFGDYELVTLATTMMYDAEGDKFICAEFISTDGENEWDEYADITLSKFVEVAATPADPEITEFAVQDVSYPRVKFNIPLLGTQNEALNPEKLSYIFFIKKDNEVTPLVLTTDIYEELEEDMTEIPYNFSDGWDVHPGILYLNQDVEEILSWDNIGLQSIYYGCGEEHKSNIVWWYEEQGIENVVLTDKAQKLMIDGALYIIRNNKLYNVQGAVVK